MNPRSMPRGGALLLAAVAVVATARAQAGQVVLEPVTLDEVARDGFAVLGTVESTEVAKDSLRIRVKRTWRRSGNRDRVMDEGRRISADVREMQIYSGLRWQFPGVSPIEHRVPGSLMIESLQKGTDVVVVRSSRTFEALPASPAMLAKLDLFFSDQGLERYHDRAPASRLYADLADEHLRAHAVQAMCDRDLLDPSAFLALPAHLYEWIGMDVSRKLPKQRLNAWLMAMIAATKDDERRDRLSNILSAGMVTVDLPVRLTFAQSLDPTCNRLWWFLQEQAHALRDGKEHAPIEALVDLALKWESARRLLPERDEDETLRTLVLALPREPRLALLSGLARLTCASAGDQRKPEKLAARLLDLIVVEIRRAPDPSYLGLLSSIDLSHYPPDHAQAAQRRIDLLDAGLAIARAAPDRSAAVFQSLGRWAADEKLFGQTTGFSCLPVSAQQRHWRNTLKQYRRASLE
jgi:hypothetical protein